MSEYVEYKGRNYFLAWKGTTKFGERAKLQFLDRSKEFWVDASAIKQATGVPQPRKYGRFREWGQCWECGCEGYLDSDGYCGC